MSRSRSLLRILATSVIGLGILAATGTAQADPPPWAHGGWHRDWHHDDDDHDWRGGFFPPPPPAYYPPPPVYYAPPPPPPPPPVYYAPPPPPPVYYAPPVLSFGINVPLGGDDH